MLDSTGPLTPFGQPVYVVEHLKPDEALVSCDPASNATSFFIGEGGAWADRVQYGDDGWLLGPLARAKRDMDRMEKAARQRIRGAFAEIQARYA